MRFNSPLSAVLSGQFLLEESAVPAFLMQVTQLLTATSNAPAAPRADELLAPPVCFAITADATSVQLRGYGSLDDVPAGSVAVTVVSGVMLPDDYYDWDYGYVAGTRTLGARIQQADAHPNIVAHVGWFITPGGSTLGLESFGDIVAHTSKPFVSYADMMCSAGMWAGSGADRVVVAKTGILGSIGTKWDGLDMSGYYEKLGIKQVTHTATASTDKTTAFDEALKGKGQLLRSQLLDPLNDVFVATMTANRPDAGPETQTGLLYVGQASVDAGLADQLGSLQDAIQLAFDLADGTTATGITGASAASSSLSTPNPQLTMFGKKVTALAAVMALAGKDIIATAEADAANEELRTAGVTSAALITEAKYNELAAKAGRADAAEAKVGELTTAKTKLETDLAASQAEVTRLGALGGATPTTPGKAEGDQPAAPAAKTYFDPNAEHNSYVATLIGQ